MSRKDWLVLGLIAAAVAVVTLSPSYAIVIVVTASSTAIGSYWLCIISGRIK